MNKNHSNRTAGPALARLLFALLLLVQIAAAQQSGWLSGRVTQGDGVTPLPDCNIRILDTPYGTSTDSLGLFVVKLPLGRYRAEFSHVGYKTVIEMVELSEAAPRKRIFVPLQSRLINAAGVTVLGEEAKSLSGSQQISRVDMRKMPTVYSDFFRSLKILPGISSNNELSSAYNVRGGNFDENLIYLNGFEIYRPFLLRRGVEENQSFINPDLVERATFYPAAFPADLGDKMSSALEVRYRQTTKPGWQGGLRADLFNAGGFVAGAQGRWQVAAGGRYSNPGLFVEKLQTAGDYRPRFYDLQLSAHYQIDSSRTLEVLLVQSDNRFDLTPSRWTGNFKFNLFDVRAVEIDYQGGQEYRFRTGLQGLRFRQRIGVNQRVQISLARFASDESEYTDLLGTVFYDPDARSSGNAREVLRYRNEQVDNRLNLRDYRVKVGWRLETDRHLITIGGEWTRARFREEQSQGVAKDTTLAGVANPALWEQSLRLNRRSYTLFAQDNWMVQTRWKVRLGARINYQNLSQETLLSPRLGLDYLASPRNRFYANWGIYYQPPFFYELRYATPVQLKAIRAQRAVHYVAGWEHRYRRPLRFQVEAFYKSLERLLPFYQEEVQLVYLPRNLHRGYAAGFDVQIQGELVPGLNSWIGYGYLNSKERPADGDGPEFTRLLGQRHTLRIFLQDRVPAHPNIQAHVRFLYGSGYRYLPDTDLAAAGPAGIEAVLNYEILRKYQPFARVDMGLSGRFQIQGKALIAMAEVLNVFNNINVASYRWIQVFGGQSVRIPNIYTRRFFNVRLELEI